MPVTITFGWGAPSFKEQLPALSETDAEHFDLDNQAIIRLHLRGFISTGQRDQAIKRVTRKIERALALVAGARSANTAKPGEVRQDRQNGRASGKAQPAPPASLTKES